MANSEDERVNCFDNRLVTYILEQKHAEVQSFLEKSDNLQNLANELGATPLHYAAEYGNATVTQYLIDAGCNVDALDNSGRSPLMLAVNSGHVATVGTLLKANADVEVRDDLGRTVLESVLQCGAVTRSPEVIALFLNKVRDVCSNDDTLMAEKFMEIKCNILKVVALRRPGITKIMLERGCSVHERDAKGNTALHEAVESMDYENVQLLLRYGARVDDKNCHGKTPLFKFDMRFEDKEVKLKMIKILLDNKASLTEQDPFGLTPLTLLFSGADREMLQVVMKYDVELIARDKFRQTPLHYLVNNPNPGVFEVIRGKKFEVNSRNPQGFTPLLTAVKNYDLEKVEFLIEHGADVNTRNYIGHTPLFLLFMDRLEDEKNISNIVELLLQNGADAEARLISGLTVLDLAANSDYFFRVKPVITSLVMDEVAKGKSICKLVKENINSNSVFKNHYEKCKKQIRQMRYKVVHGRVTLYKLLFEEEDKLKLYTRNEEFEAKFRSMMERVSGIDGYILSTLNKRVGKFIRDAEFKRKSALAICRMSGLPMSACYTILFRIINYLSYQDLENLLQL